MNSYLIALHSIGLSHVQLKKLFLSEDGELADNSYEEVFNSLSTEKLQELGWKSDEKMVEALRKRDTYDFVKQKALIEKSNIKIITWGDASYPERLKQIGHAPYFFYVRGTLRNEIPLIGIVGSRKNTQYGKKCLESIIPELTNHNYGVVSGGAYGIDTLAHTITLEHSGYTLSVLGTGIDIAYPAQNVGLFRRIIESGGAIISHFPLGTKPELYNFPMRNELVAALSLGVLIPEAAEGSGTIITAQLALEHGRDVFAIPGDIDRETSGGTNRLIATGQAKCITSAVGILEEYENIDSSLSEVISIVFNSPIEESIYTSIRSGSETLDEISQSTELDLMEVMEKITLLEIMGYISMDGATGKYRVR